MSLPASPSTADDVGRKSSPSGSPLAAIGTVVSGLFLVASGAGLAVVAGHLLDVMRRGVLTSIDSVNAGTTEMLFPLPIPIVVAFVAGLLYRRANSALSGRPDRWAGIGPWPLMLIGVTAGIWWAKAQWAPADQVGSTVDITTKTAVPWVWQEWALYSTEFWLAPVVTIVTIIAIIAERVGGRSADKQQATVQALLDAGNIVPGIVTFVGEPTPGQRIYYIEWQVQFTVAGEVRSIHRTEAFPWKNPPTQGQQVAVLVDAAVPSDASRTFVSLGSGEDAAEYLRKTYEND